MESAGVASMDGKKSESLTESVHKGCLICRSTHLVKLDRYHQSHLVQCPNCRFVFSQRIPEQEQLMEHYEHYGRNDFLSPITIKRFYEILSKLEPYRKTNRMLDVGCGIGYFLEVAKQRNWDVYGTEFTDRAVEICMKKGIQMRKGQLNTDNYASESFDVIISIEVLEHINNPVEETYNFNKLLRKGGVVYLTTPNFNSLSRRILKEKWNVITYPEHLGYYQPRTLRRLFNQAGFQSLNIRTSGISITRFKSSRQHESKSGIASDSEDEKLRSILESDRLLHAAKRVVNGVLNVFSSGDSIKAIFQKS